VKDMQSNNKFWGGLFLGAATVTAIALFLTSEKGKKMVEEALNTTEKLAGDVLYIVEKGKSFLEELEFQNNEANIS